MRSASSATEGGEEAVLLLLLDVAEGRVVLASESEGGKGDAKRDRMVPRPRNCILLRHIRKLREHCACRAIQ